jgi:RNA polymerase sigma-70 factor (ECF subfamily)
VPGADLHDRDTYAPSPEEAALVAALRAGDEDAFMEVARAWGPQMLRVALMYVPTRAIAEDVVQETWLAVLRGIDRFEGRSSLRTWVFRIVVNRARTRGAREARSVPFSSLEQEAGGSEPSVDADRFRDAADRWPGHWTNAGTPRSFDELPEQRLLAGETLRVVEEAIAQLPPAQRAVITLRDIEHWDPAEVCSLLDVSEGNQRVLLHRARSKVRQSLEEYLHG